MAEKRTYTEEARAEALALYVQVGVGAASRKLDIPQGTIASWAARTAGMQAYAAKQRADDRGLMDEALEARQLQWDAHRSELQAQFAAAADVALAGFFDATEEQDFRRAQSAITSAAIATDKAQLLAGGATSRQDQTVTVVARQEMIGAGRAKIMELAPPVLDVVDVESGETASG